MNPSGAATVLPSDRHRSAERPSITSSDLHRSAARPSFVRHGSAARPSHRRRRRSSSRDLRSSSFLVPCSRSFVGVLGRPPLFSSILGRPPSLRVLPCLQRWIGVQSWTGARLCLHLGELCLH
ncbi:acetolactate synthase isozyme1 large subunit [Sesbania bispinosa]|nr:acetolactate synthase isozyme1 large subunit [Sesbania bispinosa]